MSVLYAHYASMAAIKSGYMPVRRFSARRIPVRRIQLDADQLDADQLDASHLDYCIF